MEKIKIIEIFTELKKDLDLEQEETPSPYIRNDEFIGYIEGPSNTILTIEINFNEKENMTEEEIKNLFIDKIIEAMNNFDPGKEYEEQYELNCGPSAEDLEEAIWADEEYFSDKALSIKMNTNRITEDDDIDHMLIVREKELEQEIENLNKKTNKLWQDVLTDKDFVSELEKVSRYEVIFIEKSEQYLEFYLSKIYKPLVGITMKNGVVGEPERIIQESLMELANYTIEKYKMTKEIMSEVRAKFTQKQIKRIEETIAKIKNIY